MNSEPLRHCAQEKPAPFSIVLLFFEEGPILFGFWTGTQWVVRQGVSYPIRWRALSEHHA